MIIRLLRILLGIIILAAIIIPIIVIIMNRLGGEGIP